MFLGFENRNIKFLLYLKATSGTEVLYLKQPQTQRFFYLKQPQTQRFCTLRNTSLTQE